MRRSFAQVCARDFHWKSEDCPWKKIRVKIEKKEDYITLDVKKEKIKDTETEYISERLVMTHTVQPTNFTQLYIPFDYFKRACKMIQSYYSETNDYAGYHNFMHYWAMNGDWRWIGDTDEAEEVADPFKKLNYTYLSTGFWNDFDPKNENQQHPYTDTWDHDNDPDTAKVTYAKTINW